MILAVEEGLKIGDIEITRRFAEGIELVVIFVISIAVSAMPRAPSS